MCSSTAGCIYFNCYDDAAVLIHIRICMYVVIRISHYQGNLVISGVLQTLYFTLELVINVISPVGLLMFTYHHLYN